MARGDAQAIFRISTRGVSDRGVSGASRKQREVQQLIREGLDSAARRGLVALRAHAPHSARGTHEPSDELMHEARARHTPVGRGLRSSLSVVGENLNARNPNIRIGSTALSGGGFPYTQTSRTGRRFIVPKDVRRDDAHSRPTAKSFASGFPVMMDSGEPVFALGRRAMLRFPDQTGKIIYRFRVRAWKPTRDWADAANPEVRAGANQAMLETSQKIDSVLSGRGRGARVRQL